MNATDLIGKKALRTQECDNSDLSKELLTKPVAIEKVTDEHIICKIEKTIKKGNRNNTFYDTIILSHIYCDDNWLDYDDFIHGTSIEKKIIFEKEREKVINKGMIFIPINLFVSFIIYELFCSLLHFKTDSAFQIGSSFFAVLCAIEFMYPSFKELIIKYKERNYKNVRK